MTDTIEQKALALVNEAMADHNLAPHHKLHPATSPFHDAICRAIEQHEAYKQEVSDAVAAALDCGDVERLRREGLLSRFIITKPDPLVEALNECGFVFTGEQTAVNLRAALAARGLEVRKIGEGE